MNFKILLFNILGTAALTVLPRPTEANVALYPLFGNDMVLQRDQPLPVWGTASPGEIVTVSVGKRTKTVVADPSGTWRVVLDKMHTAPKVPFKVSGFNGTASNTIELQNVALGDVYICSGQSNMALALRSTGNGAAEIAAATYPSLRLFTVPRNIAASPQKSFASPTMWQTCSPQSAAGFSAIGLFFGRELNQKLGVPIGLINSTSNGATAQAWTSRDTLLKRDDFRDATLKMEAAFNETPEAFATRRNAWYLSVDKGTKEDWSVVSTDVSTDDVSTDDVSTDDASPNDPNWKTMVLPSKWEDAGLPDFDGVVWFRKSVDIPVAWEGHDLTLHLGGIDDFDTTFFNGVEVGAMDGWEQARHYKVPASLVKAGRAIIAVRVLDLGKGGGLYGGDAMRLELRSDTTQKLDLAGNWKYQVGAVLKEVAPPPIKFNPDPGQPEVLYNGMIAPLVPFALRGVIWYQGEGSAGNVVQNHVLLPDLIRDWRTHWDATSGGKDFGFYFVQLTHAMPRTPDLAQSGWVEQHKAQTIALSLPRTGIATTTDIGHGKNNYPADEQIVGKRLALNALAKEYGQKVEYSGPTFKAMQRKGSVIQIEMTHADGLKTSDGAAPKGFAICGDDEKWQDATAQIVGHSVVVSNETVPFPKAVRYAWADDSEANLVNSVGLLANPFRTDWQ